MSCTNGTCGIEGWGGPLPGDPSSDLILSATSEFGGIMVSWTYPTVNPYAVSYILLYRGTRDDFDTAVQIGVVSGDRYLDSFPEGSAANQYYWIRPVSRNGTDGMLVGPVYTHAKATIEDTIRQLSGRINSSFLNQELTAQLGVIPVLGRSITQEVQDRMAEAALLAQALGNAQAAAQSAITVVEHEVTRSITAERALVTSMDIMAAGFGKNIAGLAETVELKTGPTSAIATKITTLESTVNGNTATGEVKLSTQIDSVKGTVAGLYTCKLQYKQNDGTYLIGGFGMINDGKTVDAIFNVNTFAIGGTDSTNTIRPFIVTNGTVYMNDAVIKNLQFNKLVDDTGTFMVQNGKLRATAVDTENLVLSSGTTGGRMVITKDCITVYDNSNNVRVKIGNLS